MNFATTTKMIRIGNLSKICFSRISTIPAAAGHQNFLQKFPTTFYQSQRGFYLRNILLYKYLYSKFVKKISKFKRQYYFMVTIFASK